MFSVGWGYAHKYGCKQTGDKTEEDPDGSQSEQHRQTVRRRWRGGQADPRTWVVSEKWGETGKEGNEGR